jgi:dolichyl-diphosphooligosaccharide--protein glycosyltransferase
MLLAPFCVRRYDYMSWYPLGRPVGTTIYPGMQISSVFIWQMLGMAPEGWGEPWHMSLNDVCCFVPVWYGVLGTFFLGLLTMECTGSWGAGGVAALIMSVVPAHVMRCHGGGFDNESIAIAAMCLTFYCWCRALRPDPKLTNGEATRDSVTWGVVSGFAYFYMVAAWGGYIFVINMVALHAGTLCVTGRYSSKLHRAYTLFYVIGTLGAIQIPVVGLSPLKSLEQISGLLAFIGIQFLEFCEVRRRRDNLGIVDTFILRVKVALPLLVGLGLITYIGMEVGYFQPLGARIRGLFVKHTRTGNPLVDSVAEHQPADERAYAQYLGDVYKIAPYGLGAATVYSWLLTGRDSSHFLTCYALAAYYFASKMARLIVIGGPVGAALAGVAVGVVLDLLLFDAAGALLLGIIPGAGEDKAEEAKEDDEAEEDEAAAEAKTKTVKADKPTTPVERITGLVTDVKRQVLKVWDNPSVCVLRIAIGYFLVKDHIYPKALDFYGFSHQLADGLSQPSIMFQANLQNGQQIIVDDYREAYHWLRDKTPEDSRVMAWWDYGYQITGIGNRTTIADGNTWNHEHIATLGRILSAPEERSHRIAKHLADYVLVWAGGGGDDLAKSPHMARIGNSVYGDICPGDPTCSQFGFYHGGKPTKMMENCLLYKMCLNGQPGVKPLNSSLFRQVFMSKYGKVKIFKIMKASKKSKEWIANPDNRVCDAPGSWYCTGQYPPPLKTLIDKRKNFAQLEDFNTKKTKEDEKYNEEYMKRMDGQGGPPPPDEAEDAAAELNLEYVGCYGDENQLGEDKEYGGGVHGANIALAVEFSRQSKKRYLAIARVGTDGASSYQLPPPPAPSLSSRFAFCLHQVGPMPPNEILSRVRLFVSGSAGHNFAFSTPPTGTKLTDSACDNPCADTASYKCGCADASCGDAEPVGDSLVRRWVVYELPKRSRAEAAADEVAKKKKKKKKKAD